MKLILVIVLTLAGVPALAEELFLKKSLFSKYEPVVEKFQNLDKKSTIGDYPILPVTDGMKIALAKVNYSTGVVVPQGRIYSYASKGDKFFVGLDAAANLSQAQSSDWIDTPCKREDFLWKRSIGGGFQDVNCVSISHVINYFVNTTGEFQQLAVELRERGLEISPTVIRVQFTRYSSQTRRLVYIVDINPELYGIDRDASTPWGSNSWHKAFINRDEKKVNFVERLKKWAADVQDRMDDAFIKNPQAFAGLKSLDEYLSTVVNHEVAVGDTVSQTESRLVTLKSLYEKGLMTEAQYNDQVRAVLNRN